MLRHQSCVSCLLPIPCWRNCGSSLPFLPLLSSCWGCLQPARFAFPLQSRSPTFPQLLLSIPRPCKSSLSLSPFAATGLCIYALHSLMSSSVSCFQVLLLSPGRVLCSSSPVASPSCLGVFPDAPTMFLPTLL